MDEERRFKIKEIKKYSRQISNEKRSVLFWLISIGILGMVSINRLNNNFYEMKSVLTDSNLMNYYASLISDSLRTVVMILDGVNLGFSINQKQRLQDKVDELKEELGDLSPSELEYLNSKEVEEESKGRGR